MIHILIYLSNLNPRDHSRLQKFEFNEIIIVSHHRTRLKHIQLNTKYSSRLRAIQNYDTYFNLSQ